MSRVFCRTLLLIRALHLTWISRARLFQGNGGPEGRGCGGFPWHSTSSTPPWRPVQGRIRGLGVRRGASWA